MTPRSICFAIAASALLVAPSGASANPGNASVNGGTTLELSAGFGDTVAHTSSVSYSGGAYLLTDTAGLVAGAGCVQGSATTATCADPGLSFVLLYGSAAGDSLTVNSVGPAVTSVEVLGARGDDTIVAREDSIANPGGSDLLKGDDGNDTIDGGYGPDTIFGGRGSDTTTYANRPASQPLSVTIDEDSSGNPDAPEPEFPDGAAGESDSVYTENVIGGAGNDVISGVKQELLEDAGPANKFTGGGGNDRLLGGPGGDQLDGGAGNDKLFGGAQKDKMNGAAGRDRCVGGPSKDTARSARAPPASGRAAGRINQ